MPLVAYKGGTFAFTSLVTQTISRDGTQRSEQLRSPVLSLCTGVNLLTPTRHVMHQQFNIQQLYVLPTLYLCVLYLSENKQRLVPLTA